MTIRIKAIQVEHHESGLGINVPRPRLSWRFDSDPTGDWIQCSYQLSLTRSSYDDIDETQGRVVTVDSEQSVLVPWPDEWDSLISGERVGVKVRVKGGDQYENSEDRDRAIWTDWIGMVVEAGLLNRDDWVGKMIGGPIQPRDEPKRPIRLRKKFYYEDKPRPVRAR